jgi:non-specific serine/threonine protein kinase
MTVFAGGCDLRAIEAVCVDDDLTADELAALVASLVDSAVLTASHRSDGTVRYAMPGYLAAYGRHKLGDQAALERWQGRHAQWIAGLAAEFRGRWIGDRQGQLLREVRREHANVRAALEFCTSDIALAELVLGIATDLDVFWVTTGLANEGRHWLEVGLESQRGKPADRALAMVLAARFAGLQHDLADAQAWLEQASAAAEAADDDRARGLVHLLQAVLAVWDGNLDTAVEAASVAVPMLRTGDGAELVALSVYGMCLGVAGDHDTAVRTLEEAIARAEEMGETFRRSQAISGLAELALADGDHVRAGELVSEALQMKAELDDRMGIAVTIDCLARIALAQSRLERAAVLLGAAHSIWDAIGMRRTGNPFAQGSSPWESVHTARRRMGKAAFRKAFRRGSTLTRERAVQYALTDELDAAPSNGALVEESPLTRRETEVAGLVAQGLSNPEIAARLVISVRTAQGHVENILRKLGFTSRSMIAAWVAQRDAVHPRSEPPVPA